MKEQPVRLEKKQDIDLQGHCTYTFLLAQLETALRLSDGTDKCSKLSYVLILLSSSQSTIPQFHLFTMSHLLNLSLVFQL